MKTRIPELILIGATLFYWVSTAVLFNPVAIVIMLVLLFQLKFKNKIAGVILSSLLLLICTYMLLALGSELSEFPTFNADAGRMLFVGLMLFGGIIGVSGWMMYGYVKELDRAKSTV